MLYISKIKLFFALLLVCYKIVLSLMHQTKPNTMKPLFAFLAAFVAMAAADQEQIITALIFMGISVYFILKSLQSNEQH